MKKERKIFTDNLIKDNRGRVDWKSNIGKNVSFNYCGIIGYVTIRRYIKEMKKIIIEYNSVVYNDKPISTSSFLKCGLGYYLGEKTREFKINIFQKISTNKIDLTIIERKINKKGIKLYKYHCNKCRNEDWITEYHLLSGKGCNTCCRFNAKPKLGINTIWDTDRWMCDLGVSEEDAKKCTKGSGKKIEVVCSTCGNTKKISPSALYKSKSIGCICGDGFSYPEKFMYAILKQLEINFETQYSPSYLIREENGKKSKKYSDFYIKANNLIIEMDGGIGHDNGLTYSKSSKTIEDLILIDRWKDEQHLSHGVKTIRVNCFESDMEYIRKNILDSELINYFNFNNIDWLKCESFAITSNLLKDVCSYWNNKKEWETTLHVFEAFDNIKDRGTIINYLKKGNKVGLCNYNPRDEVKKTTSKNGKKSGKPVSVCDVDGRDLKIFDSITELCKNSERLFGVKFVQSSISEVVLGNRNTMIYKGFIIKCLN